MSGSFKGITMNLVEELEANLDPRLPLLQDADLMDKVVLLRVDHNVVKRGEILDQYRIDVTLATMYNIIERGGRPILMTHVGRPLDKKTKTIKCDSETSVSSIIAYLERKLCVRFAVPDIPPREGEGILDIDTSINRMVQDLKARRIGGIYLPNTRWFAGEESKTSLRQRFAVQLAGIADVYVNDAFGSWQPHASTYDITKYLPSFAGLCMQNELIHVKAVLSPQRPFVAVVAGSKYDTKIGPLTEIYKVVDRLMLGGVLYNTFLCAKYGVRIKGVDESDIELASKLVESDREEHKMLEPRFIVEVDDFGKREEGKWRVIDIQDLKQGQQLSYILDVDPSSFDEPDLSTALSTAKTVFVNAVMGLVPLFSEGTAKMTEVINANKEAKKFYGGGDTLQEFKRLHPGFYHAALDDPNYYLFTGGGTVLNVIESNNAYGLQPVQALIDNATKFGSIQRSLTRT